MKRISGDAPKRLKVNSLIFFFFITLIFMDPSVSDSRLLYFFLGGAIFISPLATLFFLFLHFKPLFPDEPVTSPTTDRSSVAKKRFTLQGFSNLKSPKGNVGRPREDFSYGILSFNK